ncbi:MAG: histidine triad nucleotide-binding protein [Oscillospiraceae bacterium]|jgi:histidine triad (HIT) family protein|nr:histidine triad nucleotide-binding protein [Oscillospiraceae bacterium]
MPDCLFCKIVAGDIPGKKVYEDDSVLAFYDIAPQAPVHVLVVPKAHVGNLHLAQALGDEELGALLRAAARVAEHLGLSEGGYRVVINCGLHAAQSVHHLHLHVLGGAQLSGQMG